MNISQILIFTERLEFKTLLELECKGLTGFNPVIQHGWEEFRTMLNLFESIDLLIIDGPDDKNLALSLASELRVKSGQIKKLFILSKEKLHVEDASHFAKDEIESLLNALRQLVGRKQDEVDGYISIPLDSLLHFKVLPFDLYVKIGEEKYIKRIPAHEEIDPPTFEAFKQKGIQDLHFERRHNRDFSLMLMNNMINKVEKNYDSIPEKLTATSEVYLTTHQIVGKLGFKPKVIEVCESVLEQITEDVSQGKDQFARFLEQLRSKNDLSFHYRLMELTSFIASQMIVEMEKTGAREKIKKVIFASMFCDYTLKNQAQLHLRRADQVAKLLLVDQKEVNEHALRASELVNKYQNAPLEASLIIKQHHGSLTGVGFSKDISPKILPLSKVLMSAQEISYQILMESHRHPIDVLSDVKINFIDTPLEDFFTLFETTCLENLRQAIS